MAGGDTIVPLHIVFLLPKLLLLVLLEVPLLSQLVSLPATTLQADKGKLFERHCSLTWHPGQCFLTQPCRQVGSAGCSACKCKDCRSICLQAIYAVLSAVLSAMSQFPLA